MELWLLIGAVILVALTVWIVWPVQRSEEVPTMSNSNPPNMPPQGDAFEDQYTAATADLSAGGVATSFESGSPVNPLPESAARSEPWSSPAIARSGMDQPMLPPGPERSMFTQKRTLGAGATALLAIGGGIGGAWLYQRSQRRRNRPLNRLRRRAQELAGYLPAMDDLPDNAKPVGGGAAAAALLSTVLLARAARSRSHSDVNLDSLDLEQHRDSIRDALMQGRDRARRLRVPEGVRIPDARRMREGMRLPEVAPPPRQTLLGGLGLGGTAVLVGAVWLVWRLLRGGGNNGPRHLYITDRMGE